MAEHAARLSADDVRKVARLARLAIPEDRIEEYRERLGAVLGYVESLKALDVRGVEPLAHGGEGAGRLRGDEVGPMLETRGLLEMAPQTMGSFVKVPKVIGDGGGA